MIKAKGLYFIGIGIFGGEEGARFGAAICQKEAEKHGQ